MHWYYGVYQNNFNFLANRNITLYICGERKETASANTKENFSLARVERASVQRSEASRLCAFYSWQVVAQVVALRRDFE